jgi:hypothetical protein
MSHYGIDWRNPYQLNEPPLVFRAVAARQAGLGIAAGPPH